MIYGRGFFNLAPEFEFKCNLLWAFEIPVNDFVIMEVFHSGCNLFSPIDESHWGYFVGAFPQKVE